MRSIQRSFAMRHEFDLADRWRAAKETEAAAAGTPIIDTFRTPRERAADLPILQQAAMLGMMNSTLARGVATRLIASGGCQDRPSFFDYRAIVAQGYAYRGEEGRWHTLTPEGWRIARALLTHLCEALDVHVMTEDHGRDATYFKCSCGNWSTTLYGKPGMYQWRRARNGWLKHVPQTARAEAYA